LRARLPSARAIRFRKGFLHAVNDGPEVVAAIVEAAWREKVVPGDRHGDGGVGASVGRNVVRALSGRRSFVRRGSGSGLHAFLLLGYQVEAVEDAPLMTFCTM
jgi:hypothetical protein